MATTPAHRRRRSRRPLWLAAGVVVTAGAVAGVMVSVGISHHGGAGSNPAAAAAQPSSKTQAKVPLTVTATTPAAGAANVDTGAPLTVTFSTAVSLQGPMPTFTPPLAGAWAPAAPNKIKFVAAASPVPGTQETLTVPGGPGGMVGTRGQALSQTTTVSFGFAPGSEERLQQLLGELGYLPVGFISAAPVNPQQMADPQPGNFTWRFANLPASLTSLWTEGKDNVITRGAVMSFESLHNMTTDGQAGPQFWWALLQVAQSGTLDPQPYDYVYVTTTQPQNVTVYSNGAPVYNTLANTGIPQAPTDPGTYPVYLRYDTTTMSGTNPDGSHYSDPGIPWVSYFNGGDALHGFDRPGYGYPQSLGCVEMPPDNAGKVYPLTPIGTLVTIQ